jgi:hypothetical protein
VGRQARLHPTRDPAGKERQLDVTNTLLLRLRLRLRLLLPPPRPHQHVSLGSRIGLFSS